MCSLKLSVYHFSNSHYWLLLNLGWHYSLIINPQIEVGTTMQRPMLKYSTKEGKKDLDFGFLIGAFHLAP